MGLPTKNKTKTSTRTAKTNKQKHGLGEQTQANKILQMFLLMRKFATWVCGLCTHTQSAHTHTCMGAMASAPCMPRHTARRVLHFCGSASKKSWTPWHHAVLESLLAVCGPMCGHQLTHTCMHACRPHICWPPFHIYSATGQFHVLLDQVHMVPLFLDHSRPRPFHHSWNKIPVENSWKFGRPFCGFCSKCQESEI